MKALQDLENAASGDAAVRQKIASLPQEVQDVSLLEKITGSRDHLDYLRLYIIGFMCCPLFSLDLMLFCFTFYLLEKVASEYNELFILILLNSKE